MTLITGAVTFLDTPCPSGHYCPAGTQLATQYPCPAGTFNNVTLARDVADCVPCPGGHYCDVDGLVTPSGLCAAGETGSVYNPAVMSAIEMFWESLRELYHRRVCIQVCSQIDPESYEWGLSARSVDFKWNPQRRRMIGELNRLCSSISSLSLFLEINITKIEASVTLFAFVILISQFLENDMFSIKMDPHM